MLSLIDDKFIGNKILQKSKEIINTKFRLLVTLEGKAGYVELECKRIF